MNTRHNRWRAAALATLAVLAACVTSDPLRPGASGPNIPIYQVENIVRSDWVLDPYRIESATVAGNQLTLDIQYGGGCREHTFLLVFGPDPSLALHAPPPRMLALLGHDGERDPCEAALRTTLEVDLSSIATAVDTTVFDVILVPPDDTADTLTLRVDPGP